MNHRLYDPERDKFAVQRIWRETGWLEKGKEDIQQLEISACRAIVADINGEAECLVLTSPGRVRYLEEDLPFSCVVGVTTSRIARKQGLAGRLTAAAVAEAAAEGALVAGLGMFEQGYYNQLGFGCGGYEHRLSFDPSTLAVDVPARVPRRITADHWELVHASRCARLRAHGSVVLDNPQLTRAHLAGSGDAGFGLGYCDGPYGELTHHFWCYAEKPDHGPYQVQCMAFQTREQFLELMALLRGLGDQVRSISMTDPPGIQLQDLVQRPFHQHEVTKGSPYASKSEAYAWWQARLCDLPACMARTHLCGEAVQLNLQLHDPIERFLDDDAPWRGVSGEYVVTLGPESSARSGNDPALPALQASVNAFTRMWLGVRPATGLSYTDELCGPPELLARLDSLLRLPEPRPDWGF